jgi:hypothetical protein
VLNARFAMNAEVALPGGERGRVVGIYFHGRSDQPRYLVERKDEVGVLYQLWAPEEELAGA